MTEISRSIEVPANLRGKKGKIIRQIADHYLIQLEDGRTAFVEVEHVS